MATLITGVNGFIGKNLANFLRKKNIEIIGNGRKKKNMILNIFKMIYQI